MAQALESSEGFNQINPHRLLTAEERLLAILCPTVYWTSILLPALFWLCSAQWQRWGGKPPYRTVFSFLPQGYTKIPYEMSKKGKSYISLPYWRPLPIIPARSWTCLFQSCCMVSFCGFSLGLSMPTCLFWVHMCFAVSSSYSSMWDFSQGFLSSLCVSRCGGQIFQRNSQLLICQ